MKYFNVQEILPENIIKEIQAYIDGELIYIPRKSGNQKGWGEKSGIKRSLKDRNSIILKKYNDGLSIRNLAKEYFLSEQSIRRIIREEKKVESVKEVFIVGK